MPVPWVFVLYTKNDYRRLQSELWDTLLQRSQFQPRFIGVYSLQIYPAESFMCQTVSWQSPEGDGEVSKRWPHKSLTLSCSGSTTTHSRLWGCHGREVFLLWPGVTSLSTHMYTSPALGEEGSTGDTSVFSLPICFISCLTSFPRLSLVLSMAQWIFSVWLSGWTPKPVLVVHSGHCRLSLY